MSISDTMMWRYYELLSWRSLDDVAQLKKAIEGGANPRDAKVAIAQEIVERFHSRQAAEDALADFINRSKGGIPDDIAEIAVTGAPLGLAQLLKQTGLCASTA
jgi:tyrosyl-tRNA synthetase